MLQNHILEAMLREVSGQTPGVQPFYAKRFMSGRCVPEEKLHFHDPVGRYIVSALKQEQVDTVLEHLEGVARRFCGWDRMTIEGIKEPGRSYIDVSVQSRPDFAEQALVSARQQVSFAFRDTRARYEALVIAHASSFTINIVIP